MLKGTPSAASRSIAAGAFSTTISTVGAVVEPGAGDKCVLDMALERARPAQAPRRCRPAPRRSTSREAPLGEHRHLEALGEVERRGQPRRARSDDEDVGLLWGSCAMSSLDVSSAGSRPD